MDTQVSTSSAPSSQIEHWNQLRVAELWTAEVRAFAKKADLAVLYFEVVPDAPSWRKEAAFVTVKFVQNPSQDNAKTLEVRTAGFISRGYRDDLETEVGDPKFKRYCESPENQYAPTRGAWVLHLYPNQATPAYSCLMSIPTGSRVFFSTRLDYHTSPVLAEHRLHGDVLEVEVEKGKQRRIFGLEHHTGPHNSARFGFGEG